MNRAVLLATLRLLPQVSRPLTAALVALAVFQATLGLAFMLAVGRLVGLVPAMVAGHHSGWAADLAAVGLIYVAQQFLLAMASIVDWQLGQRLNNHLDDRVMALMLAPPGIGHLEDTRTRDLASEVADGLGTGWWRPKRLPGALRTLVSGALGLVLAFGVLIRFEWWLGLLVAGASAWALHSVVRHSLGAILEMIRSTGEPEFRRLTYERDAAVGPASAKEVRLFGFGSWLLDRWQERLQRVLALDLRKIARLDAPVVTSVLCLTLVVGGGFAWTASQVGRDTISLAAGTVLAQALLAPLAQFGSGGQALINLVLASRPVRSLLELQTRFAHSDRPASVGPSPSEPRTPEVRDSRPEPLQLPASTIRIEGLHFRYPGSDIEVLRGLDLEIPAGTSLALVGLNGAGKTTLVKLLCRFYEPTSGRVTVDGVDLREYDPMAWQRRIAAIFQDFARLPFSARDNIRAGCVDASNDQVLAAARLSGIDDALADLPRGWDTVLSREFDDGTELSGGQWQRVALARALLAAEGGARLLVMDEPAANMDIRAEAELNERFLELRGGVTTLVISHRFSTVRQADRICVLESGQVVEFGDHDELMTANGRYARMFQTQAERFNV